MKFKFEGEPHELAALLRGLMASQVSADLTTVLPQEPDVELQEQPTMLDGTAAFVKEPVRDFEAYGLIERWMDDFLKADATVRHNLVRVLFADPRAVEAFQRAGGVLEVMQELGYALELTPEQQERFATSEMVDPPTLKNVVSLIYTLANIDNLLPEDLKIAALPVMSRAGLMSASGELEAMP